MAESPTQIGPFEVRERLGTGGMGVVYLAYDPPLDRLVAVKVLNVDDEEIRQRFLREARFAARVQHPNIVAIYAVGQHEGRPYMAMEYIAGDTLASIIRSDQPVAMGRRVQWLYELANGLEFAHRNGIVHRDVKPANLIVSRDSGLLRLLDFGIARDDDSDHTMAGHVIGTPSYMSPEQVTGGTVDARSDIFAFGLVAYELLCGARAFQGANTYETTRLIVEGEPVPLATRCPELPAPLVEMVHRCLAKSPQDRPGSLVSVRADLKRVLHRLDPVDEPSVVRTVIRPAATATLTPTTSTGDRQRRQQRRRQQIQSLVARARDALTAGDLDAAIEAAEQADLFDDRTPELSLLLQDIHAERTRRDVEARIERVRAHIDQGDASGAEAALSEIAPEAAPEAVPTLRQAIAAVRLQQRVDRCARDLQALLASRDPVAAERRLSAEAAEVRAHPRIEELRRVVEARRAEEEARLAEAAEARRQAEEAERLRRQQDEEEAEARRRADEADKVRRQKEEEEAEAQRRAAVEAEARLAEAAEARKRAEEAERLRRQQEEEEAEARRRAEEADKVRRQKEEEEAEAQRRAAVEAEARLAEAAEARRRAEEAERLRRQQEREEAEARRRAEEADKVRRQQDEEEAEAQRRATVEAEARRAEAAEARRRAEEAERVRRKKQQETETADATLLAADILRPPAPPTPLPSPRPGLPMPVVAGGLAVLLLLGTGTVLWMRSDGAGTTTDITAPPGVAKGDAEPGATSPPESGRGEPADDDTPTSGPTKEPDPAAEPPSEPPAPTGTPILAEIRRLGDAGRIPEAVARWRQATDAPDRDAALAYLLGRSATVTRSARAAAEARGAQASPAFEEGRSAEARGSALASRRSVDATEQFRLAASAYARATAPAPAPTQPQVTENTRPPQPLPTNVPTTVPKGGQLPGTTPNPVAPPPPAPAAPDQRPAVLAVLDAFAAAYNTRDVGAVAAVWPSMPAEWRSSLTQSFRTFSSVDWSYTSRTATVNGDVAQVLAAVTIRRTGSRGSPTSNGRYQFDLRRRSGAWVIERVVLQ